MRIDHRALVFSESRGWVPLREQSEDVQKKTLEQAGEVWTECTKQQIILLSQRHKVATQG